jgi:RNA polymerase sigma-70 factor (ECF subfamily)
MAAEREALVVDLAPTLSEDEAFTKRSDEYLPRALGLAFYIMGNASEAEDATQEAMARAWKARRSLRRAESFEAWIDRIVVNTCREKLRRGRRVREVDLASEAEPEDVDRFGALLSRDSVGRALLGLTVEQRAVVVLRYWRDMSLEQIARQLGWPLGTVKSRLHHAHAALRGRLERDDSEVQR